ncbi:S8 family serine peptidase [Microtetraspora sp. NBRC 16547]|uniref:S8 family serine peptidase n=1 Tax=Microtetraspora sp. NBRC 16547 TaxID=3030993 RepID=UPI0024A5B3E2|nr:S8 family serine peptidase [Microtetraspora sp. NBRC 16547]GLX00611.1 type VII secretion-associated serine protease [Microtetraspora sp. NBRC 16547]
MMRKRAGTALLTPVFGVLLATGTAPPAAADAPPHWEVAAMNVPQAHKAAQGKGVTVAVLDTGVVANHPALKGRVITGPDFVGGGARPGMSYWGEHGTAMASNVLNVAPQARVLSVRVIYDHKDPAREKAKKLLKSDKQAWKAREALAKGIKYAVDKGAKVISMSLGTSEWAFFDIYEEDTAAAVGYALAKGVVIVAASGNGGGTSSIFDKNFDKDANNNVSYPAAYPGVIGVAASGPDGRRAEFSQVHTYNAISAPGVGIVGASNTGGYRQGDGTSDSCSLAAGVVALMLSRNPDLNPGQVRDILTKTAKHPTGGWNPLVGYGQVDAAAAVTAAGSATKAEIAAVPYKGKKYFGNGPTDEPFTHPPIDSGYLLIGGTGVAIGLLFLLGAFLLLRRPRARKT